MEGDSEMRSPSDDTELNSKRERLWDSGMTLVIVKNSRIKSTVQVDSPPVNHVSKYVIIYLHNPVLQSRSITTHYA